MFKELEAQIYQWDAKIGAGHTENLPTAIPPMYKEGSMPEPIRSESATGSVGSAVMVSRSLTQGGDAQCHFTTA